MERGEGKKGECHQCPQFGSCLLLFSPARLLTPWEPCSVATKSVSWLGQGCAGEAAAHPFGSLASFS